MSIHDFLSSSGELMFGAVSCTNLNCNTINGSAPGTGGGSSTTITSSDNSVTLSTTGSTVNITNAGANWASHGANAEVNMNENNLNNCSAINFQSFDTANPNLTLYQGASDVTGLHGLYMSTGGNGQGVIGQIFDTQFNQVHLTDVLSNNKNSAGGYDIVNVGNLSLTSYLNIGNSVGNSSQIHLNYGNGLSTGNNFQIVAGSDTLNFQLYKNNTLFCNALTIHDNGVINISDGTNNGSLYSTLNPMPNGANHNILNFQQKSLSNVAVTTVNPVQMYNFNQSLVSTGMYFNLKFSSLTFEVDSNSVAIVNQKFRLYLGSQPTEIYNPNFQSSIIFTVSSGNTYDITTFGNSLYTYLSASSNNLYLIVVLIDGIGISANLTGLTFSGMFEISTPNITVVT